MALDPAPGQVPLSALCVGGGREGVWRGEGGGLAPRKTFPDISLPQQGRGAPQR